ncbi:GyrI-like domain-containing protein [Marinimicrobium sp. ARAG 43.8]|uniref:GyrI-like domain-containing protein n=1 Tax=Marinimicrobium sp. ARAG 43.8 TaxID=3418719 RepID=UPI003CF111E9
MVAIRRQPAIKLAGLRSRLKGLPYHVIPTLLERFSPYRGWFPGQVDRHLFGALMQPAGNSAGFEYLTAVEVENLAIINADWEPLEIPSQHYAIFSHTGHLSNLRTTTHSVFANSLPSRQLTPLRHTPNVPLILERYSASFDIRSGWGEIQLWVPLDEARSDLPSIRKFEPASGR